MTQVLATTAAALDAVVLDGRPLLVVDVDEVLLRFVSPFERFLARRGFHLAPLSYAITGNVRRIGSTQAIPAQDVHALIAGFFAAHVEDQTAVDGAAEALARLSNRCDVVLLTNVPPEHEAARGRRLAQLGIVQPMVVNHGPKGPPVAHLAARSGRPIFFVDDGPTNLASVRDHVAGCRLVQFVDDARYLRLAPEVPGTWLRTRDWSEVVATVEAEIAAGG